MPLESSSQKGRHWEQVALPVIGGLAPGVYNSPLMTVDEYGRITSISSNPIPGTIQALDEGATIPSGPFGVINFTGAGVIASDAGGGQINVNIPGGGAGISLEDESTLVNNGPHSILNFLGSSVQVVDAGLGRASVIVTDPTKIVKWRSQTIGTAATQDIDEPVLPVDIARTVTVSITTAYSVGTTIEIRDGNSNILMPSAAINAELEGTYVFETPDNVTPVGAGGEQLQAIISGGPVVGDAVVEVRVNAA